MRTYKTLESGHFEKLEIQWFQYDKCEEVFEKFGDKEFVEAAQRQGMFGFCREPETPNDLIEIHFWVDETAEARSRMPFFLGHEAGHASQALEPINDMEIVDEVMADRCGLVVASVASVMKQISTPSEPKHGFIVSNWESRKDR